MNVLKLSDFLCAETTRIQCGNNTQPTTGRIALVARQTHSSDTNAGHSFGFARTDSNTLSARTCTAQDHTQFHMVQSLTMPRPTPRPTKHLSSALSAHGRATEGYG